MTNRLLVPRRTDGQVDPRSDIAREVTEILQRAQTLTPSQQFAVSVDLLPRLLEYGWWELFTLIAHPTWVPCAPSVYHREFWNWGIEIGSERPDPLAAIWPRGGAKTTNVQLLFEWILLQDMPERRVGLYVGLTQKAAEEKVNGIATLVASPLIREAFPDVARIYRDDKGRARNWTKSSLTFGTGYTLLALGMDVENIRGLKIDEFRPTEMLFDDLESRHDTDATTAKKIETITSTILPARARNCMIVYVQNLIKPRGIMAQLSSDKPPFLTDRHVSGPWPQVRNMRYKRYEIEGEGRSRFRITGQPVWPEGLSLKVSEDDMAEVGPRRFMTEKQHEVTMIEGASWTPELIDLMRVEEITPELAQHRFSRIVIGVDPSVGDGTKDECGIVVAGYNPTDRRVYILEDASLGAVPRLWCDRIAKMWNKWGANILLAEANHGYLLLIETIGRYYPNLPVDLVHAKKGKKLRHEPAAMLSELGRVRLAGSFEDLELQMMSYTGNPKEDSPDRLDGMVYDVLYLLPVESNAGEMMTVRTVSVMR